ncbi:hypothetical protein [Streptomyces sp. G-G2]|uniref:hypothetical protein n=1 Tax=Streptomyces sp. G-G2 TaxID=3046201 RepID=UPI0024B9F057|nr:hypothetical protein [Streptomyces sp. G-G2]MDJ0383965.1 hypothetical protein [Streptomyces sp. G-G2]
MSGASFADHEVGRVERAGARMSALIEEVRVLPEGAAPHWLLGQAETALGELTG